MPRIVIADDHDIVRRGVRNILETQNDWVVVGEAESGHQAIELFEELKPDAIVMDITMPGMNGLDATREIAKKDPNCKVLILTMHEGLIFGESISRSGAKGLLTKTQAADELVPALKTIIAGGTYFH
jgi:two-component system, NarL family, invasion response regulator UvrY